MLIGQDSTELSVTQGYQLSVKPLDRNRLPGHSVPKRTARNKTYEIADPPHKENEDPEPNNQGRERRLLRFVLQNAARELLPGQRVGMCLRLMAWGKEHVEIRQNPETFRAHYRNLAVCGSVWACPVCASRISEYRRLELREGLDRWLAAGGGLALVSLTVQHTTRDNLAGLLADLQACYVELRQGGWWRRLQAEYGIQGHVKALEVTHGESGWHPHIHWLLILDRPMSDHELNTLENDLRKRWQVAVKKHGRSAAYARGAQVSRSKGQVDGYMSKWGPDHELTKAVVKTARDGNRGPFGLLYDYAVNGDSEAGDLYTEYATVFKGKRQLIWSNGLKKLMGVGEVDDQQIADAELATEDDILVASIGFMLWRSICENNQRGVLLEVASQADHSLVRLWLEGAQADLDDLRSGEP